MAENKFHCDRCLGSLKQKWEGDLSTWKDSYHWLHEFNYHKEQHEKLKKTVIELQDKNKMEIKRANKFKVAFICTLIGLAATLPIIGVVAGFYGVLEHP